MEEKLLDIIDDQFSGAIWVTENVPKSNSKYFHEINYLLNGLIQESEKLSENEINLFFTNSFGKIFFVIHSLNTNDLNERLSNVLNNFKKQIPEKSKILFLNDGSVYPKKAFSKLGNVEIIRP